MFSMRKNLLSQMEKIIILPRCAQGELSKDPSTGEQSAPGETLTEFSSGDTVANNPLGNDIEFQNLDDSLKARGEEYNLPEISMEGTVEAVPRELPEQSLLVPDSSNGQGIDLKDSEKQHSDAKDDVRSIPDESPEDCPVRTSGRIRRPPGVFHYPELGKPLISFAQTLLEGFHKSFVDTLNDSQSMIPRNTTSSEYYII
ncbi:hypothetical protein DPX16_5812 [Anabarilius grahami]|uniref:Uncharacterized protein n=1 Tax=Anabarilius grahami TaxID=495550 RepID=A0A3N0YV35_ANAGA|nr:hypothetical protein DPX16_5812 [Anabarilius grahami]